MHRAGPLTILAALVLFSCSDDSSTSDATTGAETAPCASCQGCCANDQCLPGNTISACGTVGMPCSTCLSSEQCLNGVCVPAGLDCTPSSCSDGCCAFSGACMRPPSVEACGLGGASCQRCGNGEVCLDGRCELSQSERYALRLYSAVLDSFCDVASACDPYAEIALGDAGPITTPTLVDTDTPQWDFKVLEATLADLTGQSLSIVIKDEDDLMFDGTIGECLLTLDAAEIISGSWSGACGDDVTELVLHFTPTL